MFPCRKIVPLTPVLPAKACGICTVWWHADGSAVLRRGRRRPVHFEEVPVDQRAPILRRYLNIAPGARPHFPVTRGAPLEDFEHIAVRCPVFHITSPAASLSHA